MKIEYKNEEAFCLLTYKRSKMMDGTDDPEGTEIKIYVAGDIPVDVIIEIGSQNGFEGIWAQVPSETKFVGKNHKEHFDYFFRLLSKSEAKQMVENEIDAMKKMAFDKVVNKLGSLPANVVEDYRKLKTKRGGKEYKQAYNRRVSTYMTKSVVVPFILK